MTGKSPVKLEQQINCEFTLKLTQLLWRFRLLGEKHIKELLALNLRCFKKGENYNKHTFSYLLNEPKTLSYRAESAAGEIVGFIFVMTNDNGGGHITTIGVAPEHRRRGLAVKMMQHAEEALKRREISTVSLEVRVSNIAAQNLYNGLGYTIVQRLSGYYNNGEDGFLMVKALL
jgi:ribosomal-protein-alanine acetyltransferase